MNLKFLLPACAAITLIAFSSCKKENAATTDNTEVSATYELSTAQGNADNTTQDANDVLNEAAVDKNFMGSGFVAGTGQTRNMLSCAVVTVTPLSGFPKNIVIDFGTGCTSPNGITRSGKIIINVTDSLRNPGSISTMTFDNYFVRGYKKEGPITWTNTSTPGIKSWHRTCQSGKITAPNGNYWLHYGAQNIVQSMGASTPFNTIDDEFTITGGHTVTNAAGRTRTGTILTALHKKTACRRIDQGTYQLQGPNHIAVIDYGNGTCDANATISIDGQPPQPFILN